MTLCVLNVAHPFAPVAPDTAGGAEQVLGILDRALCAAGHRSLVLACTGSQVAGTLLEFPAIAGGLDDATIRLSHRRYGQAITTALERWHVDVVHMHGLHFHAYLPPPGAPVLATLHLPLDHYPPAALDPARPGTWLNCVSAYQHGTARPAPNLLPPIENGVDIPAPTRHARRRFALVLSRICPEKGVHLAIEAAKRADMPLLIAGTVYPYAAHRRYFEREIRPRLDRHRRYIGAVGPDRKRRLLAAARCVLVPSLVAETSSLVAREAAAAGTPVIAFARGALTETVRHGRTGFLVEDVAGMAAAIDAASSIAAEACRRLARERFSLERMTSSYLAIYELLARQRLAAAAA